MGLEPPTQPQPPDTGFSSKTGVQPRILGWCREKFGRVHPVR